MKKETQTFSTRFSEDFFWHSNLKFSKNMLENKSKWAKSDQLVGCLPYST